MSYLFLITALPLDNLYQNLCSGYNLPRFWEVRVWTVTECYSEEENQSSGTTEENCFNRTDVVKTELRENNYYISVMSMINGNQWILNGAKLKTFPIKIKSGYNCDMMVLVFELFDIENVCKSLLLMEKYLCLFQYFRDRERQLSNKPLR